MQNQEWEVSEFIFYNLEKLENQNDLNKLTNKVNYWISLKNRKGVNEINEEIKCFDFSARIGIFKAAKSALLDEYDHINEQLEEVFMKEKGVFPQNIEEWPLFIQYRNTTQYNEFVNRHKEQFVAYDYTPDLAECEEKDNDFASEEAAVTI